MSDVEKMKDVLGVQKFADAMIAKLARKRVQGRAGWWDEGRCSIEELEEMFADHIKKGDMVDIGNFAMMVWNREQKGLP